MKRKIDGRMMVSNQAHIQIFTGHRHVLGFTHRCLVREKTTCYWSCRRWFLAVSLICLGYAWIVRGKGQYTSLELHVESFDDMDGGR